MKITESDINHNAVRLIMGLQIWDMFDATESDNNLRLMALGYAQGVCELADELKQVLKE